MCGPDLGGNTISKNVPRMFPHVHHSNPAGLAIATKARPRLHMNDLSPQQT